jgi:hypothetical protein
MTDPISVTRRSDDREGHLLDTAILNKISWGAVFAGVALALSVQALLNLLGLGIGLAVVDPSSYGNPAAATVSTASAAWFVASGVVASFVGGYIASRLSARPSRTTGGYHGLTAWAVTTLLVLYLLTTSLGAVVGGAFSGVSSMLGGVGQTASTAASVAVPTLANNGNPFSGIEQQIRSATGGNDPQALRDTAVAALRAVITGDQATLDDARNKAAAALARAQNIPVDQAKTQVADYEAQYKQSIQMAKQKAIEAAQSASKALSTGAIVAFVALLIGAIAAWFGGVAGTVRAGMRRQ